MIFENTLSQTMMPDDDTDIVSVIKVAEKTLNADRETLALIDRYIEGEHNPPYMPKSATAEYRILAQRSVLNLIPTIINAPAQMLYVDSFRRSNVDAADGIKTSPEMKHWQDSRLDSRQVPVHAGAISYGQSYVVTKRDPDGKVRSYGISPHKAVGLYRDPATDLDPVAFVYFRREGRWEGQRYVPELIEVWDETRYYLYHRDEHGNLTLAQEPILHGASKCPGTRFTFELDLRGNVAGAVVSAIPTQDRINQTVFDLLVAQTYSSFEVRTVTGMAPPIKMRIDDDGQEVPVTDDDGNPVMDNLVLNASRWMFSSDKDTKFDHLPGGNLDGFIKHIELAFRQLSAIKQIPPHYMLGQIANISAEALQAAQNSLLRLVEVIQHSFGESWERVFRIAAEMSGDEAASEDSFGEVIWRDTSSASLSQTADALGKFADNLDIPKRALWSRVPGASSTEISEWNRVRDEEIRQTRDELKIMQDALDQNGGVDPNANQASITDPKGGVLKG